ncbi:peptidase M17, leucyl aminopeptidase, partial [Suillus clintonianus]|uniref:peptidase M17, leucyl aminopeptidase n=1 Tax=Suillus clintonianus TaxID=1904413 RepID=UPI001B870C2A
GKSVEIGNTDAEGRLVLADVLYRASTEFKPDTVIDVNAALIWAMYTALGEIYTGVFTVRHCIVASRDVFNQTPALWNRLRVARESEYTRFFRMPFDEYYDPQIYSSNADWCNVTGACTAALFLKAFVDGTEAKDGQGLSVQ